MADTDRFLLARGPWEPGVMRVDWRSDPYEPDAEQVAAADRALQGLRDRGSPSHDGLAGSLAGWSVSDGVLSLELQASRWALRLLPEHGVGISSSCMVRSADGRWLAGRRAAWLASWAGRWALGAAGAVEVDENPATTMHRELEEEWSVQAERLRLEALLQLPTGTQLLIGQAWLPEGAEVTPDDEHDEFAWWPADIDDWPQEAHEALRTMARLASDG